MEIKAIPVENINPAVYNPRKDLRPGDPEYEKLKRSIHEFGFVEPLVWNRRTGNLVGGHQRFKILLEQGATEVECSVVDLDETQEKALNIALNKISGDWDMPKLKDLLEELDVGDFDVELTGFDMDEIEQLMTACFDGDVQEDDFDADAAANEIDEPVTKRGDIWLLGRHRLLCGDATNFNDVERLMDGHMADMVFTDPPYNVDYVGKTKDALKIKNDKMEDSKFYQFLYDVYVNFFSVVNPGSAIYVCHADSEGINFRSAMVDSGFELKQCIIWVKNAIVMGRQDYHWKHEPILYGWKPGAAHRWFGDRKQATVWEFDKPLRNAEHPTMKPIGIPARAINNSCPANGIVADFFGGSGSTLMAAEQMRRTCFMMELDPVYCDVIIRRWEEFTGQKAKRVSD